jgi:uroporphyrin-III C-methyltransferase
MAKFFIIGAGPGETDLLTVRAARALSRADVVLYDRLVGDDILSLAPKLARKIYVGKGSGEQEIGQAKIFENFVRLSEQDLNVVRLKGGDPMIFGRGVEEWLFLHELGCEVELVPGVSSATGLPAMLGIPLTARGASRGFAVVTGHGLAGAPIEWSKYSSVDTLAILMGVSRRVEIAKELIQLGRNPKELVCFIENGSSQQQKVITSNLEKVASQSVEVKAPAVWIIGNVVAFYEKLHAHVSLSESPKEIFSENILQVSNEQ